MSISLKVHKHEVILKFFLPKSKPYILLVNFQFSKKISLLFLRFLPEFRLWHFLGDWAYGEPDFLASYQKLFFQNVHFGPIRWVPRRFSKFKFFVVEICILIWYFWVIWKNYSMRMLLSIRGNNFIAHWAYEEKISSHTEHTPNEFSLMLNQHSNFDSVYMDIQTHAEHMWKRFNHMLSIRGTNFIACWACAEMISSHAEHTRKLFHCMLSIQYSMWNQYNVTNCLERRMGYKEQRLKIREREQETRNRDIRLGTEDGRQETKKWDMEQRMGYKEQRPETGNKERETRNREVRQGEQRTGEKEQRSETWNRGRETRNKEMRHGTEDGRQRAGNKEQRSETRNRGWETRNRDVRQGTVDGKQWTETWDREQRMGDKEQKLETGDKGRQTRDGKRGQGNGWQGKIHGSIPIKTNFCLCSANE